MLNSEKLIIIGGTAVNKKNHNFYLKENFKNYIEKLGINFKKVFWIVPESANIKLYSTISSKNIKIFTYKKNLFSIFKINIILFYLLLVNLGSKVLLFPSPLVLFNLPFIFFFSNKFIFYLGVDYLEVLNEKKIKNYFGWKLFFKYSHILPIKLSKIVLVRGIHLKKIANQYNQNVKLSLPITWELKESVNTKFKKNIDENNILFMGKVIKEKGIFQLVESFINLNSKYNNKKFNLLIVGDGKDLKSLQMYVNKMNINNIKFYGWVEDYNKLINIFLKTKLLVCPTLKGYPEGVPRVIDDAGNFKIPAIVSNVGGMKEEFLDGSAYIFNPNNEKLDECISKMLFDENLRKNILNQYKIKNKNADYQNAYEQHLEFLLK